jgi:hypothetical protein
MDLIVEEFDLKDALETEKYMWFYYQVPLIGQLNAKV